MEYRKYSFRYDEKNVCKKKPLLQYSLITFPGVIVISQNTGTIPGINTITTGGGVGTGTTGQGTVGTMGTVGPPGPMGTGSGGCAACLQQQHTHSRNSSNTSGDMSSKVRRLKNYLL